MSEQPEPSGAQDTPQPVHHHQVGYVATIQVLIPAEDRNGNAVDSEAAAADFVSETLREAGFVDWSYLLLGGQILSPTERIYNEPYNEGDAFSST